MPGGWGVRPKPRWACSANHARAGVDVAEAAWPMTSGWQSQERGWPELAQDGVAGRAGTRSLAGCRPASRGQGWAGRGPEAEEQQQNNMGTSTTHTSSKQVRSTCTCALGWVPYSAQCMVLDASRVLCISSRHCSTHACLWFAGWMIAAHPAVEPIMCVRSDRARSGGVLWSLGHAASTV